MARLNFLIAAFALTIGIGFYLTYSTGDTRVLAVDPNVTRAEQTKARELIAHGEHYEALGIISQRIKAKDDTQIIDPAWIELAVETYGKIGDPFNLQSLYRMFPEAFQDQEEASFIIAQIFVFTGDEIEYKKIRQRWEGRESNEVRWFLLDVDLLIEAGDSDDAKRLLEAKKFEGKEEIERLIRLARIHASTDIQKSWKLLTEATEMNIDYPQLHSWRARVAESARSISVAQAEYITALQLEPKNPVARDELAEFYRRYGQYKMAIQTWAGGLERPSADVIWLKTLFWSKMVYPANIDWTSLESPAGTYEPLVDYMLELPKDQFWNEDTYTNLEKGTAFLQRRQETYWLKLLQYLKDGKEAKALELLSINPHSKQSWQVEIETQLKRVLSYRLNKTFVYDATPSVVGDEEASRWEPDFLESSLRHQFFEVLNTLSKKEREGKEIAVPADLNKLLKSPEIFTAVFMAAGWLEVALQLHKVDTISSDYPDWLAFGITQCLRQNRTNEEALTFALRQPTTPAFSLIIGEMYAGEGNDDAAYTTFEKLISNSDDEISLRAGWMATNVLIKQKKWDAAKTLIQSHKQLESHILGKESQARIAMLSGDDDLADRLYGALEEDSTEAKSYLARRAFTMQQWDRAKELTEELLTHYPSHPILQENLRRILYVQQLEKEAQESKE